MSELKEYATLTDELIKHDKGRDLMFQRMDRIFNIEWDMPQEMKAQSWIKPVRSTEGHDALRGASRILTARIPTITVWPTSTDLEDRAKSDAMERALRWFLNVSFQRGHTSAFRDVVMSACRYDEVCGQVIYLPNQKKLLEGFGEGISKPGAESRRLAAMERSGPFSIIVRNPRDVHTLYSEYGMEAVVYVTVWPVKNLLSFYGNRAKSIREKQASEIAPPKWYLVFDISDYSNRIVIAIPSEKPVVTIPELKTDWPKDAVVLMNEPNTLGFIPWICRIGGTGLESGSENRRIPMLFSVDHGNQYDLQNTMDTLLLSEVVQHAAAPRFVKSGPGAENIITEYGDPQQAAITEPGQDLKPLQPPELDKSLLQLSDWIGQKVGKSTIPALLEGYSQSSFRNFAALSMMIQAGMVTIDPYKKLAEQWLSDACIQMLLWVKLGGEPIKAFEKEKDPLTGHQRLNVYTLNPDDINEKGMRIDVELEAEIPIDKVQRINGAQMLQKMGLSKRAALQEVGETDADGMLDEARYEAIEEFILQRFFNKLNQKDQLEFQTQLTQMKTDIQMEAQQQMMQAQQEQQAQVQQQSAQGGEGTPFQMPGSPQAQPGPEAAPGTPLGAAGGQAGASWNPAQGGSPLAQAQPGATRENQNGEIP